ncbi:lipase family protein [Pontiella sp.]|uniref:lipase family protein n=1 Tax=Pontiella sp. TaxID=2837462 RepID=UPI003568EF36
MISPKYHQAAVKLAAAIYQPTGGHVRQCIQRFGLPSSQVEIISGNGPLCERALVVPINRVAYLIWRGTVNWPQWRSNLNAAQRPMKTMGTDGFAVHAGFDDGLAETYGHALESLRTYARLGYDIVIGGHSRGAGMATDAYQLLDRDGVAVTEAHLFGAPRDLNLPAARTFDQLAKGSCFRWVANNDTVCRVPFRWMGYRHVGTEMYFDSADKLHVDPSLMVKLRGQYLGRKKGGIFDGVSDHSYVGEYVRLIGSLDF